MAARALQPYGVFGLLVLSPIDRSRSRPRESVLGVILHGSVEEHRRAIEVFGAVITRQMAESLDIEIVRGGLARPADLHDSARFRLQFQFEHGCGAGENPVLQRRCVAQTGIDGLAAQLRKRPGIHEADGQPDGVAEPLHAPADGKIHTKAPPGIGSAGHLLAAHLGSRNHAQRLVEPLHLRQLGGEGLEQSIAEGLAAGFPAHVHKGQHGDLFLGRQGADPMGDSRLKHNGDDQQQQNARRRPDARLVRPPAGADRRWAAGEVTVAAAESRSCAGSGRSDVNSSTTSSIAAYRSAGSFPVAFWTTRSKASGTSGRRSAKLGVGRCTTASSIAVSPCASNGRSPLASWYSITPKEKMSLRWSTGRHCACSGDM